MNSDEQKQLETAKILLRAGEEFTITSRIDRKDQDINISSCQVNERNTSPNVNTICASQPSQPPVTQQRNMSISRQPAPNNFSQNAYQPQINTPANLDLSDANILRNLHDEDPRKTYIREQMIQKVCEKVTYDGYDKQQIANLRKQLDNNIMLPFYQIIPQTNYKISNLPSDLEALADDIGKKYNTDINSVVFIMLAFMIISSCGRTKIVVCKNSDIDQWIEAGLVYLNVAKDSGNMKSTLYKVLFAPFEKVIDELEENYVKEDIEQRANRKIIKKIQKEIDKQSGKEISKGLANDEISGEDLQILVSNINSKFSKRNQALERLESKIPVKPQLFITDGTLTGIRNVICRQGGRITICCPDGGILRSVKNKKIDDPKLFLSGYDMEPIQYAAGNTSELKSCKNTAINIFTMTQTANLTKFYDEDFENDSYMSKLGFHPRFSSIYASNSNIFMPISTPSVDVEYIFKKYEKKIMANVKANYSQDNDSELFQVYLSDEAKKILMSFRDGLDRQSNKNIFRNMNSFVEKLRGMAVRWAFGVHLWVCDNPWQEPISLSTMQCGIDLAIILLQHGCFWFDVQSRQNIKIQERILTQIRNQHLDEFVPSKISKQLNRVHIEELMPYLKAMCNQNILREYKKYNGDTIFIVNPQLFLENQPKLFS
jgi:hypothetical protein